MLEPGSCLLRWQLTLLFSLFFLWGAANNLNDVLIRQFTKAFALSIEQRARVARADLC